MSFWPSRLGSVACCLLLLAFAAGIASFNSPAEAKTKKVSRKIKRHVTARKVKRKKSRRSRRPRVKTKKIFRVKKPAPAKKPTALKPGVTSQYKLPSHSGQVTQTYSIEQGVGETEVDNIVNGLKGVGADDVSVDTNKNSLTVNFSTANLTSIGIIKKLKSLGYTVKRID